MYGNLGKENSQYCLRNDKTSVLLLQVKEMTKIKDKAESFKFFNQ